jgi:hypothetical protein
MQVPVHGTGSWRDSAQDENGTRYPACQCQAFISRYRYPVRNDRIGNISSSAVSPLMDAPDTYSLPDD